MADVSIKYKGVEIANLDNSGDKTLLTNGKYCESDIIIHYIKPQGGGGSIITGVSSASASGYNVVVVNPAPVSVVVPYQVTSTSAQGVLK